MPCSSFTIRKVRKDFAVEIIEKTDLFSATESREIGNHLKETLSDNVAAINSYLTHPAILILDSEQKYL